MPISEKNPLRPMSPYGVSKLAAENYVRIFYDVFNLETVCLRYFNVYGSRQAYNQYGGVMTHFLENLKQNRSPTIFGDGEQTRDFVHVQDVVQANLLASERGGISGEVFNIACGIPISINQLARMCINIAQKDVDPIHSDPRQGDIRHSYADISKAKKRMCYAPHISLEAGLNELVKDFALPSSVACKIKQFNRFTCTRRKRNCSGINIKKEGNV